MNYTPPEQTESVECDCGRIHKKTRYGWASSEPAQPVAQPNHSEQHLDMVKRSNDEALLRQALEALDSGKHELRWAAADVLRARLKGGV